MTKNKELYKWLIFVFLLAILIIRLLIKDGQSKAIQIISLLGVIVAFIDLYNDLYKVNYKKEYLTVMNGTDLLKLRFNISPFSVEEQIEIENIKKYFHFCTFPDDGVERLYRRYGKKTEEYVQKHSLEYLDALIAETREVE